MHNDRKLTGQLRISLGEEIARVREDPLLERNGRNARTLVKEGPLRLTLIAIAAGGVIAPHSAPGPISVHVLEGDLMFVAEGTQHALAAGDVLTLPGGSEHDVSSARGAVFLLTIAHPAEQT